MSKKLRLVISAALLAWLAWRTNWGQIAQVFRHLRVELWLAAVFFYLVSQLVSSSRWQMLARPLGFHGTFRQFSGFYFIGMYFNLVLPTSVGGDVVRAWYLDGKSGRRLPAFLSVFVDRLSGLLVLLVLACIAVPLCPVSLPRWIPLCVYGTGACGLLGSLGLPILARMTRRFERVNRLAAAAKLYLGDVRLLVATAVLGLAVQLANVILLWLIGRAVGAQVPWLYYWILMPMVSILTLLPISLNGMGLREWGMVLFLTPLGVNEGTALSMAFLWFMVFMAGGLCGGVVYLLGSFPRPEVQSDHESQRDHSHQGRTGQSHAAVRPHPAVSPAAGPLL